MQVMSSLLKATLMLLGALIVLLLAGGFPLTEAPAVYHGGAMLAAGVGVVALSLLGMWRLAAGQSARLMIGLLCAFLSGVGIAGLGYFGMQACEYVGLGGAMWFGAIGMGCMAGVGLLFGIIFGFLAWRLMQPALWLAALHFFIVIILAGACADLLFSESFLISSPVAAARDIVQPPRGSHPGFDMRITGFELTHHDSGESYSLLRHESGRWVHIGTPVRKGENIVYGSESWPVSSLVQSPRVAQPFYLLPGKPPRLLLKQDAPVKDYCAKVRFTIRRAGQPDEVREEQVRVNKPATCEGWRYYLVSYNKLGNGDTEVQLLKRRAPGRFCVLLGLIGVIVSTACWCFGIGARSSTTRS